LCSILVTLQTDGSAGDDVASAQMQCERARAWGQRNGPVAAFVRIRPDEASRQKRASELRDLCATPYIRTARVAELRMVR
jgi:hypothetical protein